MSSISSLTKAVSGLHSAQKGLQVTGHNISNVNTKGYIRQQLLQHDTGYQTIGSNGGYKMQVGLGVSDTEIRQIRDQLADRRLRTENSVLTYYQKLNTTISDLEAIFDEPYGETVSDLVNEFWSQAQKLSTAADGVEERMSFISTASVLANRLNQITESLENLQNQMDKEVQKSVTRINEILDGIAEYNEKISMTEFNNENANDYRDQRNLLLDELSQYGDIRYFEEADKRVHVVFEGHTVVDKNIVIHMGLEKTQENSPYVKPVWENTGSDVFDLTKVSSATQANDSGGLKALLIGRGNQAVVALEDNNWDQVALDTEQSVDVLGNAYIIPKVHMMLREFMGKLTDMTNESFSGTGIGFHKGQDGVEVFIFENGKINVNEELLGHGGHNKLGTVSKLGDPDNVGDNSLIKDFLNKWGTPQNDWYAGSTDASKPLSKNVTMSDYFSELNTDIGSQGYIYEGKATEKSIAFNNIENERQAMGGVSQDEEFSAMLKYQYAYNASARMITMLDGMLDTIINKM